MNNLHYIEKRIKDINKLYYTELQGIANMCIDAVMLFHKEKYSDDILKRLMMLKMSIDYSRNLDNEYIELCSIMKSMEKHNMQYRMDDINKKVNDVINGLKMHMLETSKMINDLIIKDINPNIYRSKCTDMDLYLIAECEKSLKTLNRNLLNLNLYTFFPCLSFINRLLIILNIIKYLSKFVVKRRVSVVEYFSSLDGIMFIICIVLVVICAITMMCNVTIFV